MSLAGWFGEQRRTYLDNAGMTREFRTQLRGIKAPLFLTAYLGLFVLLASVFYFGITVTSTRNVASVQQQLQVFFNVIVGMLEFLVGLVAPVLAATSIVGEYQRQSVDLLFSSPVGPKYFLVGKLLASYRYVLLLLALTLPVSAMSVVLGGATWKDVVATYLLVSFHGLVYMSISMPIAVMTAKAVPTVMWSYMAGIAYAIVAVLVNAPFFGSMSSGTAPPLLGLCPFFSTIAGQSTVAIGSLKIPLWVLTGVITLIFARLMVLGAGAALTQAGSKEAFNLRVTGIAMCLGFPWFVSLLTHSGTAIPFGSGSPTTIVAFFFTMPLVITLPYLSTWAGTGGAKALPNGWWKLKFALRGTPASGLPYLASLIVAVILGTALPAGVTSLSAADWTGIGGLLAFWFLCYALGWFCSGLTWRSGIESSRRLTILAFFLVFLMPPIALSMIESALQAQGAPIKPGWSDHFILVGFPWNKPDIALPKVLAMAVLGVVVFFFAERKRHRAVEEMRTLA